MEAGGGGPTRLVLAEWQAAGGQVGEGCAATPPLGYTREAPLTIVVTHTHTHTLACMPTHARTDMCLLKNLTC